MNSRRNKAVILFIVMLVIMLVGVSFPSANVFAKSDLARLTIENNSNKVLTMRLDGDGRHYYFMVPAETTKIFTPERGEYEYKTYQCGAYSTGILDLTKHQKLIRPGCSDGIVKGKMPDNKQDLSKEIKIVKLSLKNEFDYKVYLVMVGPGVYVLPVSGDKTVSYTVARGEYEYRFFACGRFHYGNYNVRDGKKLVINDKHCK